ncbi:MAG: hypothetical protein Q4F67_16305 [Propionibacteriaceae bacterium]|nr:hypothetical protein [Propionibacteriaceae bacterium]
MRTPTFTHPWDTHSPRRLGPDDLAAAIWAAPTAPAEPVPAWDWVLAAPFRAHLDRVRAQEPLPWRALAGAIRVPDNLVRGLLGIGGRRRIHRIPPHFAQAVISLDPRQLRHDLGRFERPDDGLQAAAAGLLAAGWSMPLLARVGALDAWQLRALLADEEVRITRRSNLVLAAAARAHRIVADDHDQHLAADLQAA